MVSSKSLSEWPRRSIAHAMTISNFRRLASLSMESRPGLPFRPLQPEMPPRRYDYPPAPPLGDLPKLADRTYNTARFVLDIRRPQPGVANTIGDDSAPCICLIFKCRRSQGFLYDCRGQPGVTAPCASPPYFNYAAYSVTRRCRVLGAKRKSCARPEHYRF